MADETYKKIEPESILFTEKLRPSSLAQTILLPRVREELSKGLQDNILLAGTQGLGKTTSTRILAAGYDTLTINASLERGIDVIRDKVIMFASNSSLLDGGEKLKVVVLEECDSLTNDAWMSLRATIEQFHKNVRFVANCNYLDKIPDPIKSRFNCIIMNPLTKEEETYLFNEFVNRVKILLNWLKISFTEESVVEFVKIDFPDMRTLVKKIQQLYTRSVKELTLKDLVKSFDHSALFALLTGAPSPWDNYKEIVSDWGNKAADGVYEISKNFPEFLRTSQPEKINKLPLIIIACAEHQNMLKDAVDKLTILLSLCYKIQIILNS